MRYQLKKDNSGCPFLFLAPMEGVGSAPFRMAIATIGGFDEACTEFLRVPSNAHVQSLAKKYSPDDTAPYPQAAQIMGSDPELMAAMTHELVLRGAPRVELNCGCPSNRVTGRGAGSTLLKTPDLLYTIAKAMVDISPVPVTVKMRPGYDDTSLFDENLRAVEESGATFVTLHPRTKVEGYSLPAHWERLAYAKSKLSIPLVGSGEVVDPESCRSMLRETGVDAVMIGRGAVANPWVFHEIKASYGIPSLSYSWEMTRSYFFEFLRVLPEDTKERSRINQIKQLLNYMLRADPAYEETRKKVLTLQVSQAEELLEHSLPIISSIYSVLSS